MIKLVRGRVDRVSDPRASGSVRPGLGPAGPLCDCSAPPDLINGANFVTRLVAAQYLVLVCAAYCKVSGGRTKNRDHDYSDASNAIIEDRTYSNNLEQEPLFFKSATTTTTTTTTTRTTTLTTTTTTRTTTLSSMSLFEKYLSTFNLLQKISEGQLTKRPRLDDDYQEDLYGDLNEVVIDKRMGDVEESEEKVREMNANDDDSEEEEEEDRSTRVKKSRGR